MYLIFTGNLKAIDMEYENSFDVLQIVKVIACITYGCPQKSTVLKIKPNGVKCKNPCTIPF